MTATVVLAALAAIAHSSVARYTGLSHCDIKLNPLLVKLLAQCLSLFGDGLNFGAIGFIRCEQRVVLIVFGR